MSRRRLSLATAKRLCLKTMTKTKDDQDASLIDVTGNKEEKKVSSERKSAEFKTPRKRHHSTSSIDPSPPPSKVASYGDGLFSHTTEYLPKRADTPSPEEKKDKKVSWKKSFHCPESQAEEAADMIKALELLPRGDAAQRSS